MRRFLVLWGGLFAANFVFGQRECRSFEYKQQLIQNDPSLKNSRQAVENFILRHQPSQVSSSARVVEFKIITIPVIVHILFHYPAENISDDLVKSQIMALNRDFRKLNPDTTKIPAAFKSLAADCGIEFRLATVDAGGRATTGIIHKYTPIAKWGMDDKIKFSSEMGDDAWDAKSYLNIWVGTMESLNGYSSSPGDPPNKDGVVISNAAFGVTNSGRYNQGRTAVHEVGHWLGLRHLWGDAYCGDDGVADTPKQQTFTSGCPSTIRVTCDNGPYGDMYMDYMDFTNDDCLVMFTEGQKQKMLTLFEPGGPRNSILSSNGLGIPTIEQYPLPETVPLWLQVQIFPNPVTTELTINMEYDARWIGKELKVFNITGQIEIRKIITSKIQKLDVSHLKSGIYFISAEKEGERMLQKFIKL
jgi:hypothetical protein